MVWLDDEPVNACLVMAWQLPSRRVTTIERLHEDPRAAPMLAALAASGAAQCGYCNPGMVMTLTWLHTRTPAMGTDEARAAMSGNLCRCTGYGGLNRAIDELLAPPAISDRPSADA